MCIAEQVTRFTPGAGGLLKWAHRGSEVTEDWHCGLNDLALRKCRILLMAVIVPRSWNESREEERIKGKRGDHFIACQGYTGAKDKSNRSMYYIYTHVHIYIHDFHFS